ncbi:hypothetical protein RRG08_024401 [Elysia crispata]|uniref:Cytochrome c oxidase assembly protein COX20, mitochondrial n=1 Tax=Elysia crispata TaxID=231223 RepID=A0AAE1D213_9GAST|nr:hypothetical protein RRG08_024401 [Elysia crispata]
MDSSDAEPEPGFVKRIMLIPCMRNSLMYGITGGLGIGLAHFLFTSNVTKSTNIAMGSYVVVLLGTWGYCRYHLAVERSKSYELQKAMHNRSGTSKIRLLDPKDV